MPVLEHGLAPAGSDTAWPTTGFPTTEPMRDSELPGLEPGFAFAETQPMPLHPC